MITPAISLLGAFAAWVWEASWQASVVAGLVLVVQWAFGRNLSACWRNALWWLVFARLLMPELPQTRFSAYNWLPEKAAVHAAISKGREWVLRFVSDSHAYGSALVRFLESSQTPAPPLGTVGIFESKSALLQRVRRIAAYRKPTVLGSALGLALVLGVGALTLTAASGSKSASPDIPFPPQETLMQAVIENDLAKAKKALEEGANANRQSQSDLGMDIPLSRAVRNGNLDLVRLLVAHGAEINKKRADGKRYAYSQAALLQGHPEVAKFLHSQKGDACDALIYAAGTGDLDTVKRLKATASPSIVRLAADAAAASDQIAAMAELIGKPADPERMFQRAAMTGAIESMRFLLEHGADLKNAGTEALSVAAYGKQTAAVAFLLKAGVKPNGTGQPARSALHQAAQEGALEIAGLLLEAGADPNSLDERGEPPLFAAFFRDRVEIARLLLDHGARLDIRDKQGFPPLLFAASCRAPRCIELLLERGADIKARDASGRGVLAIAQHFIGEDSAATNHAQVSPAFLSQAMAQAVKTTTVLLDKGADINDPDQNGMSPLAIAAANGQSALFDLLLRRRADVNQTDKKGGTPLIHAILPLFGDKPRLGMINQLLAKGADLNIGSDNPNVKEGLPSALKSAMIGGNSGASAGGKPWSVEDQQNLVGKLLKGGARFPTQKGGDTEQMLIAATLGDLVAVRKLLAKGVSPDVADLRGWTALMSASALGRSSVMKTLIDAGANVSARDAAGLTPLWLAISSDPNPADIQRLLEKGADPNATAGYFGPVLTLAVARGGLPLVRDLLERGADPNQAHVIYGESLAPIQTAVLKKHPAMAKVLLEYGADPNPGCYENRSPLYWAVSYNLPEAVKDLLQAGADPGKVDDYNASILQVAEASDSEEIKTLIQAALGKKKTPKSLPNAAPSGSH